MLYRSENDKMALLFFEIHSQHFQKVNCKEAPQHRKYFSHWIMNGVLMVLGGELQGDVSDELLVFNIPSLE